MSRLFYRCPYCQLPHEADVEVCPTTNRTVPRERRTRATEPPPSPLVLLNGPTESPAQPTPKPSDLAPGQLVDNVYRIKGALGRGGMATVFDAEQIHMGRPVALKVLALGDNAPAEAKARMLREARAIAALSHPNICQIYDFGELRDGRPYIVMERLYGEPLSARLEREGALPLIDACDIVMQMLLGLGAAHKKGLVHRDIKPDNVFLVRRSGRADVVKLLDFGVVKHAHPLSDDDAVSEDSITRTGVVMGTPYYMAPEQAFGDKRLDGRVDIFASGVVFYECMTGKRPFSAPSPQALLRALLSEAPPAITTLRPSAPKKADRIFDRACARRREERYEHVGEMIADLQKLRVLIANG